MTELMHNLFAETLPDGTNVYLIRGAGRGLLIDCGANTAENEAAVRTFLDKNGLAPENTDLFLTHGGADSAGLCARLKRPENKIYIRPCDGAALNSQRRAAYWEDQIALAGALGVPAWAQPDYEQFTGWTRRMADTVDFSDARDGLRLTVGYRLEAVDLAGHTPGQLGLWDFERGILFCGDHLDPEARTPQWDRESDALGVRLRNLRKSGRMGLVCAYPTHGAAVEDVAEQAGALTREHLALGDALCELLAKNPATVWELARMLGRAGDPLPHETRWDVLRALFAQTEYLRRCERLSCDPRPDGWVYTLNQ